jgi:thiopeptide-type bacteriocin biosynthesis protein
VSRWTYRPADFFLVRAPAFPIDGLIDIVADPSLDRLLNWAARPEVAQALAVASESMAAAVRSGAPPAGDTARTERIRSSLLRYLARATARPTPFGLFAAVAVGTVAADSGGGVRLAGRPIRATRTATDLGWLRTLLRQEESAARLRPNDLIVRGERRIFRPGRENSASLSIAYTAFVERSLAHARAGVRADELCRLLGRDFPDRPASQVRQSVDRLCYYGVLLAEPAIDLLGRTADPPAVLDKARQLAEEVDAALPEGTGTTALTALRGELRALTPEYRGEVIRVDAALATVRASLPRAVVAAAATAATVAISLSHQGYPAHLADHVHAFLERYGQRAEVPVRQVLSMELGIGPPNGYTQPPRDFPLPVVHRDPVRPLSALLIGKLAEPHRPQGKEIELTDADLAGYSADPRPPLPVVDVHLQIACESEENLRAGQWRAVLTGPGVVPGGRTFGRFAAGVLADDLPDRLAGLARHEEAAHPGLVFAELNYVPDNGHLAAIALRPALRRYEIPINVPPPETGCLDVDDLVLAVSGERFQLRSVRLDREVVVTQGHLLSPGWAPNLCRFLLEVSQARWRTPGQVSWGAAEGSPYLPRVSYRRIVLRRAHWCLPAAVLAGATNPAARDTAVADWLSRYAVDRWVCVGEPDGVLTDNRMLIDTGRAWGRHELARQARTLRPGQWLVLEEALPTVDQAWVTDEHDRRYAAEFVIPVLLDRPPATAPRRVPRHRVNHDDRIWQGEEWTAVKLYGREAEQNKLITGPMAELLATLRAAGLIDLAFFLRYRDPAPHLRFRLHNAPGTAPGRVLAEVATWSARLARAELVNDVLFVPYQREQARYGGPELLGLAERVFTADSALVRELLAQPGPPPWAEVVACLDHLTRAWGLNPSERLTLARALPSDPLAGKVFRRHRDVLTDLLRESVNSPVRDRVDRLGRDLTEATEAIAARCAERNTPAVIRTEILSSLLHLHANRRGLRQPEEQLAIGVWQRCLAATVHLDGSAH